MDQIEQAVQQSFATLVNELAVPYFFEKLSAHGIVPRDQAEALEMWKNAGKLHALYVTDRQKAAAAPNRKLAKISAHLDNALVAAGLTTSDTADSFNKAAAVAASHPHIADAALKLQVAAAATAYEAG